MKNPDLAGETALKAFKGIIADNARCDIAHYYAGLVHQRAGNTVEALAKFRDALRANPRNAQARNAMRQVKG